MNHRDAEITDIVVVLDELDDPQTLAMVEQLKALGMSVESIDNDNSVIEGSIDSSKVHDLHKIPCVRYVRSVATYTVDFPAGDPRDLDGEDRDYDQGED